MVSLIELAEKCERVSGRSRELDAMIAEACGYKRAGPAGVISGQTWRDPSGRYVGMTPGFTSSLDAALSLVPEGCGWEMWFTQMEKPNAWAKVYGWPGCTERVTGHAHTAALALCAAALRARAALPGRA